jgi:hypothetical protein
MACNKVVDIAAKGEGISHYRKERPPMQASCERRQRGCREGPEQWHTWPAGPIRQNSAAIDFLRWQDICLEDTKGAGRIPSEEQDSHFVAPGRGISLFIKRMLPEGMTYAGSWPDANKSELKKQFDPLHERSCWKIESGHPIPAGLRLVYDGVPPGHCTLTVERQLSVKQFLGLVSGIQFASAGTDFFGTKK